MSSLLRIRPVEAAHVSSLIQLGHETNLAAWTAASYLEEIKNPNAILLRLADEDNATLGFVVGRLVSGDLGHDAEIYNIAVSKTDQGRGYGQRLLDAFIDACRQKRVINVWLEVRESNAKAISFYQKNGFERVQSRKSFYQNPPEHGLLMRSKLKY